MCSFQGTAADGVNDPRFSTEEKPPFRRRPCAAMRAIGKSHSHSAWTQPMLTSWLRDLLKPTVPPFCATAFRCPPPNSIELAPSNAERLPPKPTIDSNAKHCC